MRQSTLQRAGRSAACFAVAAFFLLAAGGLWSAHATHGRGVDWNLIPIVFCGICGAGLTVAGVGIAGNRDWGLSWLRWLALRASTTVILIAVTVLAAGLLTGALERPLAIFLSTLLLLAGAQILWIRHRLAKGDRSDAASPDDRNAEEDSEVSVQRMLRPFSPAHTLSAWWNGTTRTQKAWAVLALAACIALFVWSRRHPQI